MNFLFAVECPLPRFALACALVGLSLTPALAQDATITIDPLASINTTTKQGQLLTGLYATQATLEICGIDVIEPGVTAMNAHRRQLETELRLDEPSGVKAYEAVKADVEKAGVDCAEGSPDRQSANAVVAIYSGNPA